MNKWIKISILCLVTFKIMFSGILLNNQDPRFSTGSALKIASAEEKRTSAFIEEKTNFQEALNRTFSKQEIAILTSLDKRRLELCQKEDELRTEKEQLNKLKQGIEDRILKLKNIEAKIEELVDVRDALEEKNLIHLAKVYESTPPEQAGPMMSKLDVKLAADILLRINGRKAGKLWAFVAPQQAVKISEELAKHKKGK